MKLPKRAPQVLLRPVTLADSPFIYRLRNHPTTRRWFNQNKPIPPDRHDRWFAGRFIESAPWYVGLVKGVPVGVVRLDGGDGNYDVSVMVAPAWRGKGIASAMLHMVGRLHTSKLHAFILTGNEASEKAFQNAGFKCVGTEWRR